MVFEGDSLKGYRIDSVNDKVVKIDLPNVEERKVGKWILSRPGIYTCSLCGLDVSAGEVNHQGYVYCPKCGNSLER